MYHIIVLWYIFSYIVLWYYSFLILLVPLDSARSPRPSRGTQRAPVEPVFLSKTLKTPRIRWAKLGMFFYVVSCLQHFEQGFALQTPWSMEPASHGYWT